MVPVVEFKNVSRVYGDPASSESMVKALDRVSFEVVKGEFVAITGPSGSGKSTLLHLIGLMDRQSAGEIFVDGINTKNLSDNKLAKLRNEKIGLVFQQFNLLRATPAIVNVELPLVYRGISASGRHEIAKNELIKVGLGDRLGGQQQRVAIARALVTNPSLLLADEPTGNLDSKTGEEIIKLFEDLHEGGVTIILVSHDPNIARRAKRQVVIKDGRIANGHS